MTFSLTAQTRTTVGSGMKKLRDQGFIPAVLYGAGANARVLQVTQSEFFKLYRSAGTSSLIDVSIDGGTPEKALIQEVQVNPLTMKPNHIDFRQIRMDQEIEVDVPLIFVGEAPAVKGLAGTLVHPKESVTVVCLPANLPHALEIDLTSLKTFEDAITIGSLSLPAGVTVKDDPETMIATVMAPLSEEQLKRMEESSNLDVTAVKTEAEEKKAAEAAKEAEEKTAEGKA